MPKQLLREAIDECGSAGGSVGTTSTAIQNDRKVGRTLELGGCAVPPGNILQAKNTVASRPYLVELEQLNERSSVLKAGFISGMELSVLTAVVTDAEVEEIIGETAEPFAKANTIAEMEATRRTNIIPAIAAAENLDCYEAEVTSTRLQKPGMASESVERKFPFAEEDYTEAHEAEDIERETRVPKARRDLKAASTITGNSAVSHEQMAYRAEAQQPRVEVCQQTSRKTSSDTVRATDTGGCTGDGAPTYETQMSSILRGNTSQDGRAAYPIVRCGNGYDVGTRGVISIKIIVAP
ncbi:hypothetical protein BESB_051680 [Besnoitia besnoiti]|uniref:Uncharacterized protein n=1 Tax=Besnoitia besnoiti TaxID=94643 RepID=A0A2A9MIV3_BESBE|nr:hypothetical protein BESB_051680 [Besnoitia besnoiti]PFH35517.1 hypothetical protein BESB_051680 [Besnoitia besnoiti]